MIDFTRDDLGRPFPPTQREREQPGYAAAKTKSAHDKIFAAEIPVQIVQLKPWIKPTHKK